MVYNNVLKEKKVKKKIEIDETLYNELEKDARNMGITADELFESLLIDYARDEIQGASYEQ